MAKKTTTKKIQNALNANVTPQTHTAVGSTPGSSATGNKTDNKQQQIATYTLSDNGGKPLEPGTINAQNTNSTVFGKDQATNHMTPIGALKPEGSAQNPTQAAGSAGQSGKNTAADIASKVTGLDDETVNRLRSSLTWEPVTAEASQEAKDRLMESLKYTYDRQALQSNEQYDRAKVAADNQALNRGMGRSSYNQQVLANYDKAKINASNDIYNAMAAAYAQGVNELDREAMENARYNAEMQLKVAEQNLANEFNIQNLNESVKQRQLSQATADRDYQHSLEREQVEDTKWQKQFDTSNSQWQKQFDTQNSQWQQQFDTSNSQWERSFEYQQQADTKNLLATILSAAAQNGGKVSDSLLESLGISRADYNAMKKKNSSGGGGSNGSQNPNNPGNNNPGSSTGDWWTDLNNALNQMGNTITRQNANK